MPRITGLQRCISFEVMVESVVPHLSQSPRSGGFKLVTGVVFPTTQDWPRSVLVSRCRIDMQVCACVQGLRSLAHDTIAKPGSMLSRVSSF